MFVGQIDLLIHHFLDPVRGGRRVGRDHQNEGHHDKRNQNLRHIGNKRGQIPDLHPVRQHDPAADQNDGKNGDIHQKRHDRLHENHNAQRAQSRILQIGIDLSEALLAVLFPDKTLHNADVGHVFLHECVQRVDLPTHVAESRMRGTDNKPDHDGKDRNADGEHRGQSRFDADRHD